MVLSTITRRGRVCAGFCCIFAFTAAAAAASAAAGTVAAAVTSVFCEACRLVARTWSNERTTTNVWPRKLAHRQCRHNETFKRIYVAETTDAQQGDAVGDDDDGDVTVEEGLVVAR